MYDHLKKILFLLNEETAHNVTMRALNLFAKFNILHKVLSLPDSSKDHKYEFYNLNFKNRIGLAAGLDKDAEFIYPLSLLGFGFIEVGTVTPYSQLGNPKPRLERLLAEEAILNRMGFNSKGTYNLVKNIQRNLYKFRQQQTILGVNIGKNASTPLKFAIDDYIFCLNKVYHIADYITINISSPNTKNLRLLQSKDYLSDLIDALIEKRYELVNQYTKKKHLPLLIKISPDLKQEQLENIMEKINSSTIDGIIATNTQSHQGKNFAGGLSGAPLTVKANEILQNICTLNQRSIPIIASGGIMSKDDAVNKFNLGASLIQLYSGLIYHGPQLIQQCCTIK